MNNIEHEHEWEFPFDDRYFVMLACTAEDAERHIPMKELIHRYETYDSLVSALEAMMEGVKEWGRLHTDGIPRYLKVAMVESEDAILLAKGTNNE